MKARDLLPTLQAHPDAEVYVACGYDSTGRIESIEHNTFSDGTESITIALED